MQESPRIRTQRPESADFNIENKIEAELTGLKSDAAGLEQNIANIDEGQVSSPALQRIAQKYNNLVGTINGLTGIAGAFAIGSLLKDIVNPEDFTIIPSIDWNDIASRGVRDAVIIAGVYAIARVGAFLKKWYRESRLVKPTSSE